MLVQTLHRRAEFCCDAGHDLLHCRSQRAVAMLVVMPDPALPCSHEAAEVLVGFCIPVGAAVRLGAFICSGFVLIIGEEKRINKRLTSEARLQIVRPRMIVTSEGCLACCSNLSARRPPLDPPLSLLRDLK